MPRGTHKPLTEKGIRSLKASDSKRRHYDSAGLYLELASSGGKWWRFKYRHAGKEKLLSLGVYPLVGLAEARCRRDAARALLAQGLDPSAERKAERHAERTAALNTVEAVTMAWLAHREEAWAERTRDRIAASLQTHVFPRIGKRPIAEVSAAEIRDTVKAVDAGGARETAGRVFQRLQAVFRYAVQHDLCSQDPTYALKPAEILTPQTVRHRAALSERDVPAFLCKLDAYDGDPSTRNALELLMLTATRPVETRGATWNEFDESKALWRIPAERMKMKTEHLVPLSKQALAVLKRARALASEGLVFPSPYYPSKPLSDGTLNSALARLGYKGRATAHGFRSLFSTSANEAGWSSDAIERQLAHEERDEVRGAYNRALMLPERIKLMTWWGKRLDELRGGTQALPIAGA